MEKTLPTRGQLERQVSQDIGSLYRTEFGHSPSKIICHIFDDKAAIVAEETITAVEQLLCDRSKIDLARSIRAAVNEAFKTKAKDRIGKILQVEIIDIICDSSVDSGYLGMIVFLQSAPETRLAKKERSSNKHNQKSEQLAPLSLTLTPTIKD